MNKKLTAWAVGGLLAFTVVGFDFFGGSIAKAAEDTPVMMGVQGSMVQDGKMNRMNFEDMQEKCNSMMQDPDMQNKMQVMMGNNVESKQMLGNAKPKEAASAETESSDSTDHNAHHLGQV
jgi:hypothetical protein